MKFKYKVWAEIEEDDMSGEVEPERVGEPECVGVFDTNDEAIDFVSSLEEKDTTLQQRTIGGLMDERDRAFRNLRHLKEWCSDSLKADELPSWFDKLMSPPEPGAHPDDMRDLLEEAAGTFGEIGRDEPVSGADSVDFLCDWIPRVRGALGYDTPKSGSVSSTMRLTSLGDSA